MSLLTVFAAGCGYYRLDTVGKKIPDESVKRLHVGYTTTDGVIDIFGKPSQVKNLDNGAKKLIYEYTETRTPVYVGGMVVYEKGRKESKSILTITVKNGVVESYTFKSQHEE